MKYDSKQQSLILRKPNLSTLITRVKTINVSSQIVCHGLMINGLPVVMKNIVSVKL